MAPSAPQRRALLRGCLWFAVGTVSAAYVAAELRYAANRPMWVDEWFALSSSIRGGTFARLVLHGAYGQVSPAPLDYLLVKALDSVRTHVCYLGLAPHAYFRLVGVLATAAAAVFAFIATLAGPGRPRTSETGVTVRLFAALAFASFLLQPLVVHYAAEMRPYGLWTATSLVAAVSLLRTDRRARAVSVIALVLLAMTATASVFQIAALAMAMFLVELAREKRLLDICREVAAVFGLPSAVSLFYCLKTRPWEYPAEMCAWARFLPFWASRWWVPAVAAIAVVLCCRRVETRAYAVPATAMLLLYLMAPGIFWLTKLRGVFFAEKQYIYHAITLPIMFATAAVALSAYDGAVQRRARAIVATTAAVLCILGTAYGARGKVGVAAQAWREWRDAAGIPSDPSGIVSGLLQRELPRAFCFTTEATEVEIGNVRLVAEWLPVRYASLPVGGATVWLEPHGDGSEVKALGGSCDAAAAIQVGGGGAR